MRLIDADALLNDLKESVKDARDWREETLDEEIKIRAEQARGTFIECALRVKHAPTIEAKPVRHGRWIDTPLPNSRVAKCSLCGFWQRTNGDDKTGKHLIHNAVYRYCAGCGARMDVPDINVGDKGGEHE